MGAIQRDTVSDGGQHQRTDNLNEGISRCMTARDRLRAWDVKFFGSSNLTHKSCGIFVAS